MYQWTEQTSEQLEWDVGEELSECGPQEGPARVGEGAVEGRVQRLRDERGPDGEQRVAALRVQRHEHSRVALGHPREEPVSVRRVLSPGCMWFKETSKKLQFFESMNNKIELIKCEII